MNMYVELNKQDIRKLIAEKYLTDTDNVIIEIVEECRGYGLDEHYETEPKARVSFYNPTESQLQLMKDTETSISKNDIIEHYITRINKGITHSLDSISESVVRHSLSDLYDVVTREIVHAKENEE